MEILCRELIATRDQEEINQLHSGQHPDARIGPALVEGNELASLERHYTETHNYGSAGAGAGLAASRRSSLVVQKIYRRSSRLEASAVCRLSLTIEILGLRGGATVVLDRVIWGWPDAPATPSVCGCRLSPVWALGRATSTNVPIGFPTTR